MSEGVSYQWTVDSDLKGVDAGVKSLRDAEKGLADLWAKTIDSEKALEELKNPLDKLKGAGDLGSISRSLAPIKGHADHAAEGFKGVGHHIQEAKGHFKEFLEFAGAMLAVEAIEKLTEKVKELGMEILHAAGGAERLDMSLKLTVGEEGAKEVFEWVDKITSKTRFTDDQLKGWANQLLRAGVAMQDLDRFIAAGLDLNARGGDMATAMEALTRAQITGKIGTRQLVGLGIGINQLKELPEYQGLSEKALYKKVEEGSLTKEQLFSLIAGKDNVLGDLGVQGGQDFESKLKNLKSLPEQYFQKFAESPAFERLKDAMTDLFDRLDPSSERGERIFGSLERSFSKIVDYVAAIDFEHVADTIENKVLPAIETLAWTIQPIVDGILDIIRGAEVFANAVRHYSPLGFAYDQVRDHPQAASTVVDFAKTVLPIDSTLVAIDWVKGLFGKGQDAGAAITAGMQAGLDGGMSMVADTSSNLGQTAIDATREKLDSHSPSRVFEQLGRNVGQGFMLGIDASTAGVDDVMQGAFAIPAPQGGRALGAGMGDINLTVEVNLQGRGGDVQSAREIGQAVLDGVRPLIPAMLADALEQINASGGNA